MPAHDVLFAIYSALTEDLDSVMLPLGPSDMTLLFTSVPGEADSGPEVVRARLRMFDTWLETVERGGCGGLGELRSGGTGDVAAPWAPHPSGDA
jgi:hypothetical protein